MADKNTILIVDDDKANLLYLNQLLCEEYTIYTVRDAKETVERADEYTPDLILLDILMPEMNGYDVLEKLKESDKTENIPVVFITGLSDREDEIKGLGSGAEDYIVKPFNDEIVKLRIHNQIKIVNQKRDIERLSMIDQLTKIANRRGFDLQMSREWRSAVRVQSDISLMMVDVDKFKDYNDTHGHQQGDHVLKTVAAVIEQTLLRATDFAARWGGEEFAVLLPITDMHGAYAVAESVRANVESTVIPLPDGTSAGVTVSIGLNSKTPSKTDTIDAFISEADGALYTAKKTGRNRVCKVERD